LFVVAVAIAVTEAVVGVVIEIIIIIEEFGPVETTEVVG